MTPNASNHSSHLPPCAPSWLVAPAWVPTLSRYRATLGSRAVPIVVVPSSYNSITEAEVCIQIRTATNAHAQANAIG